MSFVCVADYEKKAQTLIEKSALEYYKSGAGDQYSLQLNKDSMKRLRIRPRCLRDVSNIDLSCNILGQNVKWPLGIAPTAMQRMAHRDGEVANARAAGKAGSIFILSTLATTSIEELGEKASDTIKWFQLYIYKDRTLTESLVRRAEKAGFKALVLTVDAPIFGIRRSDVRNKFTLPSHLQLANFVGNESAMGPGLNQYVNSQFDATLTWVDVEWLVNFTNLPVIVKGVLTPEDAQLAVHHGCKGVIVSNHGARQIDGVPASIEALPEIVSAVGNDICVMMDGGVTNGNDIFRAMAIGAKAVFIGRSALWGLAVNGQNGVEDVLGILRKDFEITMALTGCTKLSEIRKDMVVHESYYSKL